MAHICCKRPQRGLRSITEGTSGNAFSVIVPTSILFLNKYIKKGTTALDCSLSYIQINCELFSYECEALVSNDLHLFVLASEPL